MAGKLDDIPEKVIKYEHFLNETLRGDLEKNEQEQTILLSQINDYQQLRVFLNQLKTQSFGHQSQLKVQTDIGSNFYVQAVINDTKHVLMFCGLGIYLHMTVNDAIEFSGKREKILQQKLNILISKSNKTKATIKLVFEGLRELQELR